jgi:hypothetical protein
MDLLAEARQGNRTFQITFPTGEVIPFRLLSWKDFETFWELSQKGTIPADILEDVIFRECCLDPVWHEKIYDARAGIVSTVVGLINQMSSPASPESFNNDIETARQLVDSMNSQVIMIICQAFPAYKPEEIMEMAWSDVLIRLAQAERILMKRVPPELTEPLRLLSPEEQKEAEKKASGQVDVNQLIQDGRRDAAEFGKIPSVDNNLTQVDEDIGKTTAIRQKRKAMARRLGA